MNLPAQPNLRTSDISEMENGRADPTPIAGRLLVVMGGNR